MTDSTVNLDKIKDRIAKLLAMSKDTSSPNEAAIAMGRARALMDKHQLDEFEISGGKIKAEMGTIAATHFSRGMPTYMQTLSVAVAKYNDCHARYESGWMARDQRDIDKPKRGNRIVFIGFKEDAQLAADMYNRLLEAVSRLCKAYMVGRPRSTNVQLSFKAGAVSTIIARLDAMVMERDSAKATGHALMIVKRSAVDEHFGETRYKEGKANKKANWDAMLAGIVQGKTVEINKAVEA